jgi:hypothetical protein
MGVTDTARGAFAAWRTAVEGDWFADDPLLRAALAHHGRPDDAGLRAFGRTVPREIDPLVRENNRDEHLPDPAPVGRPGQPRSRRSTTTRRTRTGAAAWSSGASDVMGLYRYSPGRELDTLAPRVPVRPGRRGWARLPDGVHRRARSRCCGTSANPTTPTGSPGCTDPDYVPHASAVRSSSPRCRVARTSAPTRSSPARSCPTAPARLHGREVVLLRHRRATCS